MKRKLPTNDFERGQIYAIWSIASRMERKALQLYKSAKVSLEAGRELDAHEDTSRASALSRAAKDILSDYQVAHEASVFEPSKHLLDAPKPRIEQP